MRQIAAGLFISLDGVVEAPENWTGPYFNDQVGQAVGALMATNDAMLLGQPCRDFGDGLARFDPKIDGTLQHCLHIRPHELRTVRSRLRAAQNTASLPHFCADKRFEHRRRLRTPRRHPQSALQDRDAGLARDILPDRTAAPGTTPGCAPFLARYRDEAKIPHRCPARFCIAIYYDCA